MAYDRAVLITQLRVDEGVRFHPYTDSRGILSIGIGRNLESVGISEAEAEFLCNNDIDAAEAALDRNLVGWRDFSDARQRAIVNLCFNMGITTLLTFKDTLAAMLAGDWDGAADGLLRSKYARQVGARAQRIAALIRAG